jgi:hypothetical protein
LRPVACDLDTPSLQTGDPFSEGWPSYSKIPIGSRSEEDAKESTNMKTNDGLKAETERPSPVGVRIRFSAERRLK